MRRLLQNNRYGLNAYHRAVRAMAKPNGTVLIKSGSLTDVKNEHDGRIVSTLEKPITIELMDKQEMSNDTFIYRFALPGRESVLGHYTCQYLEFEADIMTEDNKTVPMKRYYHPMSKVNDQGVLDLLVKVYLRSMKFPKGGTFSQFIDTMQEEQTMRVTGIAGDLYYLGQSKFMIRNKETQVMEEKFFDKVGMIAAGSGITPMFQLIQTVADAGSADTTALSLIYSCASPFDILLDEDLGDYEKAGKLFYFPIVQAPDENWEMADGDVNQQMIEHIMPPKNAENSLIIVCGTPKLKQDVKQLLDQMGYENYFIFN